jgi:SAM-dependent methyltransferase
MSWEARDTAAAAGDVREAYSALAAQVMARGHRDNPTYIATKALVDWDLMEDVPIDGRSVLNVGCFEPIDEMHFAHRVGRWTAVDINPDAVAMASRLADLEMPPALRARVDFRVEDATRLSFADGTFDLAVSFSALEHIPGREARCAAMAEMTRAVKPGGHVVITVPNRYSTFRFAHARNLKSQPAYGYAYLYGPLELRRDMEACGLTIQRFSSEYHGLLVLPSWIPRLCKDLLFPLVYLGERIGCVARKEGQP